MVEKKINNNISILVDCHVFDGKFQGTRTIDHREKIQIYVIIVLKELVLLEERRAA